MLRHARMAAMTGSAAAFGMVAGRQQWADSYKCCAMHISTQRAETELSL
jgi:hypothetical protein